MTSPRAQQKRCCTFEIYSGVLACCWDDIPFFLLVKRHDIQMKAMCISTNFEGHWQVRPPYLHLLFLWYQERYIVFHRIGLSINFFCCCCKKYKMYNFMEMSLARLSLLSNTAAIIGIKFFSNNFIISIYYKSWLKATH